MQAARLSGSAQDRAGAVDDISHDRMSELLRNYPKIGDQDRTELVEFLKDGHPDSLAKAVYGRNLSPKAVQVKKDHPQHFGRGLRGWVPALIMLILVAAIMFIGTLF